MYDDRKTCKGCVCLGCAKCAKNGNVYGCPVRRCSSCAKAEVIYKLALCDDAVPLDERGDVIRI